VTGGAGPKRKGSQFERDVVAYLRDHGFPDCERAYGAGRPEDIGDIAGVPGVTLECKATKSIDLAGFVDEAERERVNARQPYGVAVVKRRGKSAADSYVVSTLATFVRLVADEAVTK
jgi:Holliday junction resolvase